MTSKNAPLLTRSAVSGADFCGAETGRLESAGIDSAIDMLLATSQPSSERVLRIHVEEGYLGQAGADNVNVALSTLA